MVPRRPPRGSDLRDQGADRADGACWGAVPVPVSSRAAGPVRARDVVGVVL